MEDADAISVSDSVNYSENINAGASFSKTYTAQYDASGKQTITAASAKNAVISPDNSGMSATVTIESRTNSTVKVSVAVSGTPNASLAGSQITIKGVWSYTVNYNTNLGVIKTDDNENFIITLNVKEVVTPGSYDFSFVSGKGLRGLIFDGNGGTTSGGLSKQNVQVISGQDYQLHSSLFTRDGYYLSGWLSGTTTFSPGDTVNVTKNTVFKAQWTAIPSGSSYSKDSKAISTGASGSTYTYKPINNGNYETDPWALFMTAVASDSRTYEVSKPDWMYVTWQMVNKKWNLTFSGTPTSPGVYLIDVAVNNASSNAWHIWWTITVASTTDTMRSVSFSMNGGSGQVGTITGPVGSAIVLPHYTGTDGNMIAKSGSTLTGWDINDGYGAIPCYPLGSYYTIRNADYTAKAHWTTDPNVLVYSMDGQPLDNVKAYVTDTGSGITLAESASVIEGYTFVGWRITQDRDIAYAPGLYITVSGPMYLEAYFIQDGAQTCTVTYDPGLGYNKIKSQVVEPGMWVKLPVEPTRSGYTFQGWSLTNGGERIAEDDYKVTDNVTLYAVWRENTVPDPDPEEPDPEPDPDYTVSFNTAGGVGSYKAQPVTKGGMAYRPADPTREGHVFIGWRAQGSTDLWDFSTDTVTSDTLLNAEWVRHFTVTKDELTITITMQSGGVRFGTDYDFYNMAFDVWWGDGVSTVHGLVGSASHTYAGTSYGEITVTSKAAGGKSYTSSMPYSVKGEHIPTTTGYRVTFDPNNNGSTASWTVTVGRGDVVDEPADPVWYGHVFTGWCKEDGSRWSFHSSVTGDMTLYAGWEIAEPEKFKVIFDPNNNGSDAVWSVDVEKDTPVSKPTDPSWVGHTFKGWYQNGAEWNFSTPVSEDITLVAGWDDTVPVDPTEPVRVDWIVTFDPNNNGRTSNWFEIVDVGKPVSKPKDPVWEGHTFTGWFYNGAAWDFSEKIEGDMTLTAGWDEIVPDDPQPPVKSEYTVTFDPNNGGASKPFNQPVKAGQPVGKPEDPSWKDHAFTGWFYKGVSWDFATAVNEDMTLTAGWDDVTPSTDDRKPKAVVVVTKTDKGYKVDASGSLNTVSWLWKFEGEEYTVPILDIDMSEMKDGKYAIHLTVTSSDGQTDVWADILQKGDGGESWFTENKLLVLGIIIVFILAMIVLRRFV